MALATAGCVGLFDRNGYPTEGGATYDASLGGFVINGTSSPPGGLTWSELQTSATATAITGTYNTGTGVYTGAGAIDQAFLAIQAYNATNPVYPWTAKIRIIGWTNMPAWLKALANTGGYGPLYTGPDGLTTLGWWTADLLAAYENLLTMLAAYVPGTLSGGVNAPYNVQLANNPGLGQITAGSGPTYAEPLLLSSSISGNPWSQTGNLGGVSSATLLSALESEFAVVVAAFPNTPVSTSTNPCQYSGYGETQTAAFISGTVIGTTTQLQGVLENNSFRAFNQNPAQVTAPSTAHDPNTGGPWCVNGTYFDLLGSSYTAMYTTMLDYCQGPAASSSAGSGIPASPRPMMLQTSSLSQMGGSASDMTPVELTCYYAYWLGACAVELPGGYSNLSASALAKYMPLLHSNAPAVTGGPFVQDVGFSTGSNTESITVPNAATVAGNACVLVVEARGSAAVPTLTITGGGTWTVRQSQASAGNFLRLAIYDLVPSSPIAANGITVGTSVDASIAGTFYEIQGLATSPYETSAVAHASSAGTAPSVSVTPAYTTDVVVGGLAWPSPTVAITGGTLPPSPWVNDETLVGSS